MLILSIFVLIVVNVFTLLCTVHMTIICSEYENGTDVQISVILDVEKVSHPM